MTSFVTETLFGSRYAPPSSSTTRRTSGDEVSTRRETSHGRGGSVWNAAASSTLQRLGTIHDGPPPPSTPAYSRGDTTTGTTLGFAQSAFVENRDLAARSSSPITRDLIRCTVVNERDAQRGFRLFDGILMSVKDVSSEDLFLERMRIVYSIYDAYVAGYLNRSPLDVTKALVRGLSACITKYFSTQSMLRTNRPFITKTLHLDGPDMFCTHSDFAQSFLFTNASPEDELIISLAEKVYADEDFDVCYDVANSESRRTPAETVDGSGGGGNATANDRLFEFAARLAERHVVGGSRPSSFGSARWQNDYTGDGGTPRAAAANSDTAAINTDAMLIVVTDFDALHNYVAYVMYMTPVQLDRRYNLNFDCLRRPGGGTVYGTAADCRERDSRKRKRDTAKAAIRTIIERRRREKIDSMKERSAVCEAVLRKRADQMTERNDDLLRHLLLMLFDKCLSSLLDRGFENLNARRGYAVNSAKEIGSATVYTGIIDTVGEVSTVLEGCALDELAAANNRTTIDSGTYTGTTTDGGGGQKQHRLHFSLPFQTIVSEASSLDNDSRQFRDSAANADDDAD